MRIRYYLIGLSIFSLASLFAMESEEQQLTQIFPLEVWDNIAQFLPGDDIGLLHLNRILPLSKKIHTAIAQKFIDTISVFEEEFEIPPYNWIEHCACILKESKPSKTHRLFYPTNEEIPLLVNRFFKYRKKEMQDAIYGCLAQIQQSDQTGTIKDYFDLLTENPNECPNTLKRELRIATQLFLKPFNSLKPDKAVPNPSQIKSLTKREALIWKLLLNKYIKISSHLLPVLTDSPQKCVDFYLKQLKILKTHSYRSGQIIHA